MDENPAQGGDMSLDSALIELNHVKKSLAGASKQETDPYLLKWYTKLVGHCRFVEKYIQQDIDRTKKQVADDA